MELATYFEKDRAKKSDFARRVNVSPALLHQWVEGIRPVAPQHCPAIERETKGLVTRKDLRPNDWHLIWPELETTTTARRRKGGHVTAKGV